MAEARLERTTLGHEPNELPINSTPPIPIFPFLLHLCSRWDLNPPLVIESHLSYQLTTRATLIFYILI